MARNGGDSRGSSYSRRTRKLALLNLYGDGETCPCSWCGCALTFETLEQDRIVPGASYVLANLQPACRRCNASRGKRSAPVFLATAAA